MRRAESVTRAGFLGVCAGALLAAAPACGAIDWTFPGVVAAYARRLTDPAPFVRHDAAFVMPAASTIKLLIALAALDEMERDGIGWGHRLVVRQSEIVGASETFGSDRGGQPATLENLMHAMIAQSDNTAANVLADWIGFARVNAMAGRAGLRATRLRRHFMDFAARAAGIDNTTTARDMGVLAYGLANGTASGFAGVSSRGCRRIVDVMSKQEDRDTIPAGIERRVPVANKTGVLPGVRHDVAIVGLGARDAYVVALLSCEITNYSAALVRLRRLAGAIDAHDAPACSSS
ncbi:MAG TPA: serine hydrolase [Candidatus Acidoferrales bacterium]|nr:serine hydrolase [Candidatus Acidoferrales bacterium]